jgi:hypothetical protein
MESRNDGNNGNQNQNQNEDHDMYTGENEQIDQNF